MDNNISNNYNEYMQKPVVVNTFLISTPIMGEVIDADENSITIAPTFSNSGSDYHRCKFDIDNTYYLPTNSIISVKEI